MQAKRLPHNPILTPQSDPSIGDNINGPSLIRVPDWVRDPLGRYYLYFGHHDGHFIRLAYADAVEGPWTVHPGGVLPLADTGFEGHIASPDVLIDDDAQEFRLYFHGSDTPTEIETPQRTRLATSRDGLTFEMKTDDIGPAYMRVFQQAGAYFSVAMPGVFLRSADGIEPFEPGPQAFEAMMRHCAILRLSDTRVRVFYTRVKDAPEHIVFVDVDLNGDWQDWRSGEPTSLLKPEHDWEGANRPLAPSRYGISHEPENALRDPDVFVDEDGQVYLTYAVAGERGLAMVRLEA